MRDTVLILDDSVTVRMNLAEAFETAGFHPLPCGTAAEAREALASASVDLVVLDVLLPDADGVSFLKEIRASAIGSSLVVLMLSAEAEVKDRVRALQTGADAYVGKPYDSDYVVNKARELLRARRTGPEPGQSAVLIIEDSLTFREELHAALEGAGYAVLEATTGEEGLHVAATRRPCAMVIDGGLPGIDGATVIRRARLDAALRGIPCLLLTASEDREAELRALDAGADAFVRKDEDITVVLARLAAVLRRTTPDTSAETVSLLGPRKILAVDDSVTYLHGLADALREEGYEVVLAHSGEEALELLAVESVDCILLDLVMPGLDGEQTCRRIKSVPVVRDIPLIILTGREDRATMLNGFGAGADDFVPKSSEFDVLRARVRAQIRRKQFEDENRRIREELLRKEIEAGEARAARELAETRAALVDELERKNRELEGANKELDAFSYTVSHDLRAPLRAVNGFASILAMNHGAEMPPEAHALLHKVIVSAKRMDQLIQDLLRFSHLGRQPLSKRVVKVGELVHEVLTDFTQERAVRQVEIRVMDLPDVVGDPSLLRQVFSNLLSNAFKFTKNRELAVIEVEGRRENSETAFTVHDNGAGFDMQYATKLFGVFQRLHSEEQFSGTGVGLSLVQRIITRHGGRIWAEAEVDKGATFHFSLPN
jgi:two-component system NtrC family sensor kinase